LWFVPFALLIGQKRSALLDNGEILTNFAPQNRLNEEILNGVPRSHNIINNDCAKIIGV
jgi:hypothetical protein